MDWNDHVIGKARLYYLNNGTELLADMELVRDYYLLSLTPSVEGGITGRFGYMITGGRVDTIRLSSFPADKRIESIGEQLGLATNTRF